MKRACWFLGHRWHVGAVYAPRVCKRCGSVHSDDAAHYSAATEERVLLKTISLRERHDVLLDALEGLVSMHNGQPESVGNWDWAFEKAEKALKLAKAPLLETPTWTRNPK